jgi:hypothetical protein
MIIEEFNVKVSKSTFCDVVDGKITTLKHGFSRNKKFLRLFNNEIRYLKIICSDTKNTILRRFVSVDVIFENDKKIIQIKFI